MSTINGLTSQSPIQKITANPIQKQPSADVPAQAPLTDRVELSGVADFLNTLKAGGDFRADKVAEVKSQIEAGTYDTDDKLDAAADKLLDELNR